MKLLLDTHAFLWWDGEPARLPQRVLDLCSSVEHTLHLSLVSVWEMQIKIQLGKLALRRPLADALSHQQQQNDLQLVPVALEDILGLATLPMYHRDPFDRMLISQTRLGAFDLVTHDPEIARYPVSIVWD